MADLPACARRPAVTRPLFIAAFVLVLLIFRNCAYVTTYCLYLDHRADSAAISGAAQQLETKVTSVKDDKKARGFGRRKERSERRANLRWRARRGRPRPNSAIAGLDTTRAKGESTRVHRG